jgi:hypothetical protein
MAVLGGREREIGIDLEGLAKLRAALGLAVRDAVAEREVLASARGIDLRKEAVLEGRAERLHRVVVLAVVVLPDAGRELVGGPVAQRILGDLRRRGRGLRRHFSASGQR